MHLEAKNKNVRGGGLNYPPPPLPGRVKEGLVLSPRLQYINLAYIEIFVAEISKFNDISAFENSNKLRGPNCCDQRGGPWDPQLSNFKNIFPQMLDQ